MTKLFWCKSCVVMSTRPRVTFNKDGICSACQWMEEKKKLNWEKRQKKLDQLLKKQKTNQTFQCITAVSGGKDGSYITYNLKHTICYYKTAFRARNRKEKSFKFCQKRISAHPCDTR